jgi:hypothetical protein
VEVAVVDAVVEVMVKEIVVIIRMQNKVRSKIIIIREKSGCFKCRRSAEGSGITYQEE